MSWALVKQIGHSRKGFFRQIFMEIAFLNGNAISSQAFCEILRSKEYILEFNKIRMGLNDYTFDLNGEFLEKIEGAGLADANVVATLQLFKAEGMYDLKFHIKGSVQCECDVCLESFQMPVDEEFKLLMKVSESENYDDDEIIYITDKLIEYDLTQYLYDSLMLSVPSRKVCDMSGTKQCNPEVINRLEQLNHPEETSEGDREGDPAWEKLRNLFNN